MSLHLIASIGEYGVAIVFIAVLIDQIGIPIPALPILIAAGTFASGRASLAAEMFASAILACLIADIVWYAIGRVYGIRVLKTLCRISLEPDSCVNQTQQRFERWGASSLLVAKFVPGLSVIAPPMAGAVRIAMSRFVVLSSLGSALWSAVGLGVGLAFSAQIHAIGSQLARFGSRVVIAVAATTVFYVALKWWRRRRFLRELRIARISVEDLYAMFEAGVAPLVIDVRTHTARNLQPLWIPTAIHAPVDEIPHRLKELPRERDIIVYCTCPNEVSAARVAKELMKHGFKRVRPLLGGLDAWVAAGYRVETGAPEAGARVTRADALPTS